MIRTLRAAIGSHNHNGAKDRVLAAIKAGRSDLDDIMHATGLDSTQCRNAIKRLQADGEIQRKNLGGYEPAIARCLLEEVWRR